MLVALPRLRPAVPGDAPQIVELLRCVAAEQTLGLDPTTLDADQEARRLAQLDLRTACALVVVLRGAVKGFAVAVRAAEPACAHTASLSLAVAPEARRRGFGRLLLQGVRAWAAAAGISKLCAGVVSGNRAALTLFDRCGYAVEGVRRRQLRLAGRLADEVLLGLLVEPGAGEATAQRPSRRRDGRRRTRTGGTRA